MRRTCSIAVLLGLAGTVAYGDARSLGLEAITYSTPEAVRASTIPAHQFAFLIGHWHVEQLFPKPSAAQPSERLLEDWAAQPDGSLIGKSFAESAADSAESIEIRVIVQQGRYFHTLSGRTFTGGKILKMPVVQAGSTAIVSVNAHAHRPTRTCYDRLPDGSILASIYLEQEGEYRIWHMTK
jgi:hypothetical protein